MQIADMSQLVGEYIKARRARLDLEKDVEKLKEEENLRKDALLEVMRDAELSEVSSVFGGVRRKVADEPTARDWAKVYEYIVEHHAFDLLQNRLSAPAVRLRWADGIVIPGIESFPVEKLTVFGEK